MTENRKTKLTAYLSKIIWWTIDKLNLLLSMYVGLLITLQVLTPYVHVPIDSSTSYQVLVKLMLLPAIALLIYMSLQGIIWTIRRVGKSMLE